MLNSIPYVKISSVSKRTVEVFEAIAKQNSKPIRILPNGLILTPSLNNPYDKSFLVCANAYNPKPQPIEQQIEEVTDFFTGIEREDTQRSLLLSKKDYHLSGAFISDILDYHNFDIVFDNEHPQKSPIARFNGHRVFYHPEMQSRDFRDFFRQTFNNYPNSFSMSKWAESPKTLMWFLAQFTILLAQNMCFQELGAYPQRTKYVF